MKPAEIPEHEKIGLLVPGVWGPVYWKWLHILAERVGRSSSASLNNEVAYVIKYVVRNICLPCKGCQAHAKEYLHTHPFNPTGTSLTEYVRTYLFTFHNAVRTRLEQPILIQSVEECQAYYESMTLQTSDLENLHLYWKYGLHRSMFSPDKYRLWKYQVDRLHLLIGLPTVRGL